MTGVKEMFLGEQSGDNPTDGKETIYFNIWLRTIPRCVSLF